MWTDNILNPLQSFFPMKLSLSEKKRKITNMLNMIAIKRVMLQWYNVPIPLVLQQNLEEKHALRLQLEGQVEDLWAQFQQALKSYQETTEERKAAFETLKDKDEKSAKEIEMQMRKLQRISVGFQGSCPTLAR